MPDGDTQTPEGVDIAEGLGATVEVDTSED